MRGVNTKILLNLVLGILFLAIAAPVLAVVPSGSGSGAGSLAKQRLQTVGTQAEYDTATGGKAGVLQVVQTIIQSALAFLGVLFLIIIIYAGSLWATAGGNQDKITKAQKLLTYSSVGLLIIVTAFLITAFVLQGIEKATPQYQYE